MYQFKKKLSSGLTVEVELGVTSNSNKEHLANAHVHIPGLGHMRGIMAYEKDKGGVKEMFFRLPGYNKTPDAPHKTSYLVLEQEVIDVLAEAVRTVPKEKYVKYYEEPSVWSIWGTPTRVDYGEEPIDIGDVS